MLPTGNSNKGIDGKDPLLGIGEDDGFVSKSFSQKMEEAIFTAAYTLNRSRIPRYHWSYLGLMVDHFQVMSLMISVHYVWDPLMDWLRDFLKIFGAYPSTHSYQAFMIYLWGLCVYVAVSYYVLYKVMKRISFDSKGNHWLFRLAMNLINFAEKFLLIPAIYTYINLYRCDVDSNNLDIINDKEIKCWSLEHIIYLIASSPFIVILVGLILFANILNFESTPNTKHLVARDNSRFLSFFLWSLIRFVSVLFFQPYYQERINNLVCGFALVMFHCSISFGINALFTGDDKFISALIFYAGILPAYYIGIKCVDTRNLILGIRVVSSQMDSSAQQNSSLYFGPRRANKYREKFEDMFVPIDLPSDTSIIVRVIFREDMRFCASKRPSKDAFDRADLLYAEALENFPESSMVLISYMGFLLYYANLQDKYRIHADKLRELQPLFDFRYLIYQRGREIEEARKSSSSGTSLDLSSYIEFQTNYKEARKYHAQAIKAIRRFWGLLLLDEERFDLAMLPSASEKVNNATSQAQSHYERVLKKHPEAPRLLRSYAEFILGISQDNRKANALIKRAEELEDKQARANDNDAAGAHGGGMIDIEDKSKAVITIDGKGIIQTVNQGCVKLLLYSKSELMGSNVKMIMPSPYSENHDTYLSNYHRTGVKKVLGSMRLLDAKNKKGELIPVRLSVHQTDVSGQVFFVGIVEKMEDSSSIITFTVDGTVLSCNEMLTKKLELTSRELVGQNFGKFFSNDPSEESLVNVDDLESYISGRDTIKTFIRSGSGSFVQVIISPVRQTQNDMAYFRCTVEFMDDIEVNISINESGHILTCNHFIRHIFGYTRQEVVGQNVNTLMPQPYSDYHDSYLKSYMTTGIKNVIGQSRVVEGKHVDGSRFKVHLLVSEGEIDGTKSFSARISFAKKTEIPCCRLMVGNDGLIRSHDEAAVSIIGSTAEMIGQPVSKFVKLLSKDFRGVEFTDIMPAQKGKGPINGFLSQHSLDTAGQEIDVSIDISHQELSGESLYVIRIFLVHESDITIQTEANGQIMELNDATPHLFGRIAHDLKGMNLFDVCKPLNIIQVGAPEPSAEAHVDTFDPMKIIGLKTKMVAHHRDGSHISVFAEVSLVETGFCLRIARKKTKTGPFLKSRFQLASRAATQQSRLFGNGESSRLDIVGSKNLLVPSNLAPDMSPSPVTSTKQLGGLSPPPKPQLKANINDKNSDIDSSEGNSSLTSGAHTGIRRIQRIRYQMQRKIQNDATMETLQRRILIALFLLIVISLALFTTIYVIAGKHVVLSYSVALCGNAIGFHRTIYALVEHLNETSVLGLSVFMSPNNKTIDTESLMQLKNDAIMLEHSLMSLYMNERVNYVYEQTLAYSNYNALLEPYEASNISLETFLSQHLKELYTNVDLDILENTDGQITVSQSSFIRSMKSYLFYARFLADLDNWDGLLAKRYIYFILNNGPDILGDRWNHIIESYYDESNASYYLILIVESCAIGVAVISVIILGVFVIRPGFDAVMVEKHSVLHLFLTIPKNVIRTLSKIQMQIDSSDSDIDAADTFDAMDELEEDIGVASVSVGSSSRASSSKRKPSTTSVGGPQSSFNSKTKRAKGSKNKIGPEIGEDEEEALRSGENFLLPFWHPVTHRIILMWSFVKRIGSMLHARKETKKWILLLVLICLGFASVTLYGNIENQKSQQKTALIYHTSFLLSFAGSLTHRSLLLAEGKLSSKNMSELMDDLNEYNTLLYCISEGCKEKSLQRSDRQTSHVDLLYSNRCFLEDTKKCPTPGNLYYDLSRSGLANVANEISRSVTSLIYNPDGVTMVDEDFLLVWHNSRNILRKGLFQGISIFVNNAQGDIHQIQDVQSGIAGATCAVIIFSYYFFFRPMFRVLLEEKSVLNQTTLKTNKVDAFDDTRPSCIGDKAD